MKKFYSYTIVYFAVFCCLHFNIFAKTIDDQPVILKPTPVKALPVRFKPLPFKPLYLTKVDLYQFDQKAYVFGKITSAFPVLSAQEWQTVSNDPVRFTLTPNKPSAYVGEEIELTLTAELLNISPNLLFTFEELREYTLKVVLPNDFIQTGGTYYDFVSDKLDTYNSKKIYTIKGRYLAKPASDDCFKVLRKLNNEVFILKATQCPTISEVDIASVESEAQPEKTREIAAIDLTKINYFYNLRTNGYSQVPLFENQLTINYNCLRWNDYYFATSMNSAGVNEVRTNNGYAYWEIIQKEGSTIIDTKTDCSNNMVDFPVNILSRATSITSSIKIYSTNVCPNYSSIPPANVTPISTKSVTFAIDRTTTCPQTNFTITASSTTICSGNSSTLEASNNCSDANIIWQKNNITFNGGRTIVVSEAGNYKAVCSSPALTSNTIAISVSTTPPAPTVTFDKNTLTPGEFAQLTGSNCSGTVLWTGPNNFADAGNQISVNKAGGYNAKCQTNCGGTYYYSPLSATIYISVAPLRIEANKSQIAPGESVTVTAYGCTNGFIKWKINDNLQNTSDNPFTFNSSGFYSASCNSWDGSYTSEWVTIFIHQAVANTPTVTANKLRAYNNENVVLTASGCSAYYWVIPVRQPNGTYVTITPYPTGNPKTVTGPQTYQVGCTNQGPWASVTVYPLQPGDITLTSNKTVANPGEAVELNITGDCPSNAGIQWKIMGQYSWTTRYESKTVYGSGTYEARCIIDDYSYGNWASKRIDAPAPGGITISTSKTSAGSTELVTLRANGCDGEVVWTLPNNTEVRGTSILFATGPGTYKAKCVRFGINGVPATIVIQTKPNDAPRFYATQSVAGGNQIFELVAENCPNNYVQWGVPKLDANGNTYYDYTYFFPTLIVRGPGTYKVRCNEGNHTSFQDIVVFANPSDALTIVANKSKALPTESVTLTAFGCPNGYVEWELSPSNVIGVQLTRNGPGTYKARCKGDPTNNGDYAVATIIPNGSIVPSLSASQNTACPNESVTVTASSGSCPAGWPFQWQLVKDGMVDYWLNNRNAIENFGENYGNVFEIKSGTSLTRPGPRIYYVRCLKPDLTWIGEFKDKSFIVEPVFPEYLRASNNGPALMGATGIKVAVTEVPGPNITYTWAGPGGFTSSSRSADVTGLTEAKSGIYTVTVRRTAPVACSVTATTNLVVSGCGDIKIKATDPRTGLESTFLEMNSSTKQNYPLALIPDGIELGNLQFKWSGPDNNGVTTSQILVTKPGVYEVFANPIGSTAGCKASVNIFAPTGYKIDWHKRRKGTFVNGQMYDYYPVSTLNVKIRYFVGDIEVQKEGYEMGLIKYLSGTTPITELLHIIPTKVGVTANSNNFEGIILQTDFLTNSVKKGWKYVNGTPVGSYSVASPPPPGTRQINEVCKITVTIECDYDPYSTGSNSCEHPGGTYLREAIYYMNCDVDAGGGSILTAPTGFGSEGTGGGGTSTPTTNFGQAMCSNIGYLLDPNILDLVLNNDASDPCKYERKYKLLLKLMEYGLKNELKKLDLEDGTNNGYENHIVSNNYASIVKPVKTVKADGMPTWNFLEMGCSIAQQYTNLTFQYPSDRRKLEDAMKKLAPKINSAYIALSSFFKGCNVGCSTGDYSCCDNETFDLIWNSMMIKGINPLETFTVDGKNIFMNETDVPKFWEGLSYGMPTYPTQNPDNPDEIAIGFIGRLIVKYSSLIPGKVPYVSFITCSNRSTVINFNTELTTIKSILDEELDQNDDIAPCTGTRRVGRASVQGTIEHWLIQFDYMSRTPSAVREFKIPESSPNGNVGYADLAVTSSRELYEIKSLAQQPAGLIEIERYVTKANEFCKGSGSNWIKGTTYFPSPNFLPYPRDPLYIMRVELASPGLLLYSRVPKTTNPLPVAVPEAYRERIRRFLERIGQNTQNLEREIIIFLNQNPDIKTYLKAAAIGTAAVIIVGTIIEDVVTAGAGIADDFASFALAYRLIRIAQLI